MSGFTYSCTFFLTELLIQVLLVANDLAKTKSIRHLKEPLLFGAKMQGQNETKLTEAALITTVITHTNKRKSTRALKQEVIARIFFKEIVRKVAFLITMMCWLQVFRTIDIIPIIY